MQQVTAERSRKTLIFAHRGANREAPENSREAFDRSLRYAIDGIETDIQLSRDEVAVLWHDRHTDKLGRPGKHIDDFTWVELDALRFCEPNNTATATTGDQSKVMRLDAFLPHYHQRCRLLLEIKNRDWEMRQRHELKVRQVLAMITPLHQSPITVSSFNLSSLVYAHQCNDQVPQILNLDDDQSLDEAHQILSQHQFLHGLCLPIASLDQHWMSLLNDQHKEVAVYTCNSEQEIRKALDLKVDILISDVPQYAIQLRDG